MNTTRIAIFIDGAYLDAVLRDECGGVKVSFAKLAQKLAGSIEILRTYYYNCLPYQRTSPSPDEATRFSQAQKFFDALNSIPRFEVRPGMLVYRGDSDFILAINVAKNEGVLIHLYHGRTPHRKLVEVVDERTAITSTFLSDVLWHP